MLGQSSASGIPFTNRPPVSRKKLFAIGGGVALALIIAVLIYSLFLRSWLISPMNSRDPATDTVTTQEETTDPPGTTNPGGSGLSGSKDLRDKILLDPAKYQELLKDTSHIKTAIKPKVNTQITRD